MRVTNERTIEVVGWALGGEVQQDIVVLTNQYDGQTAGLTGKDDDLIRIKKLKMSDRGEPGGFIDVGFVGDIEAISPAVVKTLQDDVSIPAIPLIGFSDGDQAYGINADVIAGEMTEIPKTEKLAMMVNTPSMMDK